MEAEYGACYTTSSQAIWICIFIINLKVMGSMKRLTKMYCDNEVGGKNVISNNKSNAKIYIQTRFNILEILHS